MTAINLIPSALNSLTRDGWLLFLTRFVRLFAYGSLSVILVFYLVSLGLTTAQTGLLLTLTLAGDIVVSLFLIIAGTIGVISPSGNEVGPFLSIEQAALSHVVSPKTRTEVFAWYTLAGSIATALGALFGGTISQTLQKSLMAPVESYRVVVLSYAALGIVLALLFTRLSSLAEVSPVAEGTASPTTVATAFGITRSRHVVLKLSSLFALDSFAGGFVVQSFAAYWFYLRFGVRPAALGAIFFWANIFAGITGVARTTGAAISPLFVGFMFGRPSWINVPFFMAGTLKIVYDLLLYRAFIVIPPPEER